MATAIQLRTKTAEELLAEAASALGVATTALKVTRSGSDFTIERTDGAAFSLAHAAALQALSPRKTEQI